MTPEQSIGAARVMKMLARPGLYVVITRTEVSVCEVDHGGCCFQCKPGDDYQRDGELTRDGWVFEAVQMIVGPFARQQ